MTPLARMRLGVTYLQEQAAKDDLEARRERRRPHVIVPVPEKPAGLGTPGRIAPNVAPSALSLYTSSRPHRCLSPTHPTRPEAASSSSPSSAITSPR